jgi:hypothetical protein
LSSKSSLAFVVLAVLSVLSGPAAAQVRAGGGGDASIVVGTVFDHETGEPLASVLVSLGRGPDGSRGLMSRTTDEYGNFGFTDVVPGLYMIRASLLGRQTLLDTLMVASGADVRVVLELPIHPVDLQPIMVTVKRSGHDWMEGFDERRLHGPGTFITRSEIEERHPRVVSDLLRGVPGASFVRLRGGGYGMTLAGGCRPVFWLNGQRTMDEGSTDEIDSFVPTVDIQGIEVYEHVGDVPMQFGPTTCGAVLIWTGPSSSPSRRPWRWRPMLFALGLVAAGLFILR